MPSYFPENNTPLPADNLERSLQKINDLLIDGITIGEVEIVPGSDPLPVEGTVDIKKGTIAGVTTFTTNGSGTLAVSNPNRKYFSVYNSGPAILYVLLGTGTPSATSFSVAVLVGELYENVNYTGEIQGFYASASNTARITVVT